MARLAAPAARADSADAFDLYALSARVAVCGLVGGALARAGIDSERAQALRLAPHPTPLPATGARGLFGEFAADDDGLAGMFAAKIGNMARRYEDDRQPDFANALLAELFAWCFAGRARGIASA